MSKEITFFAENDTIGANSIYLYLDGAGIILDSGMHPKKKDASIFPKYEILKDDPVDLLLVSHAHNDHLGSLPYLIKLFGHLQVFTTEPTCDLSSIILRDTAKVLKRSLVHDFPEDLLSLFKPENLEFIDKLITGRKYNFPFEFTSKTGKYPISFQFYDSGHILGSAGTEIIADGKVIFYTSDVKFSDQTVIKGAAFPKRHIDTLIIEATNASVENLPDFSTESKRLAKYINSIINSNGSILIPVFSLGKYQEILNIINNLKISCKIPNLTIYTAGLGQKINRLYDIYNYTTRRVKPGFEFTDIPVEIIKYDEALTGKYFHESSIVIVPSGMMVEGTLSFNLAKKWIRNKHFGIAFVGFLDEDSPSYSLAASEPEIEFIFGTKITRRICSVEKFRFSSHASRDEIINYITETKPSKLFITHGSYESIENLYKAVSDILPQTKIVIPLSLHRYEAVF